MSKVLENDYYTYQVSWSDGEYVGLCAEFPSLSWLAETQEEAFLGIRVVVAEVVSDMQANGEPIPKPSNINRKKLEAYPDLLEAAKKVVLHWKLGDLHPKDRQMLQAAIAKALSA